MPLDLFCWVNHNYTMKTHRILLVLVEWEKGDFFLEKMQKIMKKV